MAASSKNNIASRFFASSHTYPSSHALEQEDECVTYAELDKMVRSLCISLQQNVGASSRIAVYAEKRIAVYAGILATLSVGATYVPLNPTFPIARNIEILDLAATRFVYVASASFPAALPFLEQASQLTIITEAKITCSVPARHIVVVARNCSAKHDEFLALPRAVGLEDIAYILFTSGSTGTPKGVAISHGNLQAYFEHMRTAFFIKPDDRCSHCFELTFDLSVHDMFATWQAGACLCVPDKGMLLAPATYITGKSLSCWFSVPSVIGSMKRFGQLKEGGLPLLRQSLFCGEPLAWDFASAWQKAAPKSTIYNIYGPTEATIAISSYEFNESNNCARRGLVPIGTVFPTQSYRLLQLDSEVETNSPLQGELLLAGDQVILSYYGSQHFEEYFFRDAHGAVWYRTGDIVEMGAGTELHFVGRKDTQIKLRGYRIELGAIEAVFLTMSGVHAVVVCPDDVRNPQFLKAIVLGDNRVSEYMMQCRKLLPQHMVPREIICCDNFPLNANGKIDRKKIISSYGR